MKLAGPPIEVRYQAKLRDTAGNPAHAATFIRQRVIILDTELRNNRDERERILLHELFHFVWVRLGNHGRRDWERLLESEWRTRGRGEAGWSAEWRKLKLKSRDVACRSRLWREYCCESFCDTGAWINGGDGSEITLGRRRLEARAAWFRRNLPDSLPV